MKHKTPIEQRIRGWLPKEHNLRGVRRTTGRHSLVSTGILILFSFSLICLLVVIVFLPSILLKGEDGWIPSREVERISFPGGDIIVHEIRQTPSDKGYISLSIEANITSKENLLHTQIQERKL